MKYAKAFTGWQGYKSFIKRRCCLLLCLLVCAAIANAGTIKGFVTDNSGEAVIGAIIQVENTSLGVAAGLDGSFEIKDVAAGTYNLKVSYVSYATQHEKVILNNENDIVTVSVKLAPQATQLKETIVTATTSGTTDTGARLREKNADNILNMLSGRTIQLMPDVTVANVLRRVSGVTVDRGEDGEGRYPVIRGMDKRYNYTLVNGIKISSPDDKNRYVPMDIFPSEMLQRLEVVKALTPDMEGDAIGGVMNLVLKDAPDHLMLQAQGAIGYSQRLFDEPFNSYDRSDIQMKAPAELHGNSYGTSYADFSKKIFDFKKGALPDGQLGLTIGNRFFNHKLGVLFSGMYQSTNRNAKELFIVPNPQPQPAFNDQKPDLADLQIRHYSTHSDRSGLNLKLDYDLNSKNKITFYTLLMNLNTYQARNMVDSTTAERGTPVIPGTGLVDLEYRAKTTLQSIYNATLHGQHNIDDRLFIDWSAVYNLATQHTPDWATFTIDQTLSKDKNTGEITSTPNYLKSAEYIWQHNSDKDLSGYFNLHYKRNIGSQKLDVGVGGMYRHKDRSNYYIDYNGLAVPNNTPFANFYDAPFTFVPATSAWGDTINQNIYTITENVAAGYVEAKWEPTGKWNILAGVREEYTYDQYNQPTVPITFPAKTGTITYADVLPSLHVKYKLNTKTALHASYFKSISRPNFFEYVPYDFPGIYFNELGNPYVKHATADNVDVRYEFFPGKAEQLLIGAFYKKIQNPIEYVYERYKLSEADLMPQNFGTATNIGAEIVYTKYFHKFGMSFNYTYTYSNIPTTKKYYYDSVEGGTGIVDYVTQNRPLQGQAAHIGNISLLYKDVDRGIDLQIASIYTGKHIVYVSPYVDLDYWARGTVILDFSAEKTIGKHFAVYAKVNNMLNTPDIIELMHDSKDAIGGWPNQTRSDRILVEKKYYGQTYLLGLRYHL